MEKGEEHNEYFFFTMSIKMSICMYTKNEQVKWVCIVVWLDWNFTYVAGSVGGPPYFHWLSVFPSLFLSLSLSLEDFLVKALKT